ncbi:hypothetical protein AB0J71_23775 [Nonomuraea sp. NPDC049637]|uniref:hypothetical protein n=1 Tax=Nonomuraea sp. NPDC049637 TaxID=3154356 RepID=UPI00341E5E04
MMLADLRIRRLGRFPVGFIVVMLVMAAGCSERSPAEPSRPAQVPAPSPSASPPPARQLVDLRTKVKGNVLLHHVADSGDIEWVGKLKVGTSYKIALDCAGSQGKLTIVMSEGFQALRQCAAGYTTYTIGDYPVSRPEPYTLTINAPADARWAVLVARVS